MMGLLMFGLLALFGNSVKAMAAEVIKVGDVMMSADQPEITLGNAHFKYDAANRRLTIGGTGYHPAGRISV